MKRHNRVVYWMLGLALIAPSVVWAGPPARPGQEDPFGDGYSQPKAGSNYAEIVVRHPRPEQLEVVISSTDGRSGNIRVPMRGTQTDPGRQQPGWRDNQRDWQMAIGRVDLSRYTRYLDGRHPWTLRLIDHSYRGGELTSFTMVVDGQATSMSGGSQTFAGNRTLTVRMGEPAANRQDPWGPGPDGPGQRPDGADPWGAWGTYPNARPRPDDPNGWRPGAGPNQDPWGPNWERGQRDDDPIYSSDGNLGVLSAPTWLNYNARGTVSAWVTIPQGRHRDLIVTITMPVGWRLAHPNPENGELQRQSNMLHWRIADPKPGRIRLQAEVIAPRAERGLGGSYPVYATWQLDGYGVHYMSGSRNINLGRDMTDDPFPW